MIAILCDGMVIFLLPRSLEEMPRSCGRIRLLSVRCCGAAHIINRMTVAGDCCSPKKHDVLVVCDEVKTGAVSLGQAYPAPVRDDIKVAPLRLE